MDRGLFAHNDIGFVDPSSIDHDALGLRLKRGIHNFMYGIGLDEDVRTWRDQPMPKARVQRKSIERAVQGPA